MEEKLLEQIRDILLEDRKNYYLWTIEDVAGYLRVSTSRCRQLIKNDGFPQPIVLIDNNGSQCKRWLSKDVRSWIKSLQVRTTA